MLWRLSLVSNRGYSIDTFNPELGQMDADSQGIAASLMTRVKLFELAPLSLNASFATGPIYFNSDFPPQGTQWNFHHQIGITLNYQFMSTNQLALGYQRMHISNGQGLVDSNPAIDSDGIYFQFIRRF
nr:acyloxyacyl hydrolase [Aliikangiella sp. G2MR2-5]